MMHEVLLDKSKQRAATKWCEQHLGERYVATENRDGKWAVFWAGTLRPAMYRFCFVNEKDLVWFTLKWS